METMLPLIANIIIVSCFALIIITATGERMDSLSNLLEKAKRHNGIIEGNPLLYPECRNALISQHKLNLEYLNKTAIPNHWFWSREAIDAVSKNLALTRRTKYTHSNPKDEQSIPYNMAMSYDYAAKKIKSIPLHILNWYLRLGQQINTEIMEPIQFMNNDDNDNNESINNNGNTCFYHIEKSGSSSISGMLHEYGFNTSYTSENALFHCQCGFTFVRDPISRFVSGYYTINKLIYWYHHHLKRIGKKGPKMHAVPNTYSFWNITGEPQRMVEFINNLYDFSFEFTKITPLEHMMTQSGLLSVAKVDIHYVGETTQMMKHLDFIKNKCAMKTNNKYMSETDLIEKKVMTSFGTKWFDELRPWYTDMLSLDDYVAGDLDPAYIALADNYNLYQKVVEFYKQDYICFGFKHNWIHFRNKIYNKLHKTMHRKKKRKLNKTKTVIQKGIQHN